MLSRSPTSGLLTTVRRCPAAWDRDAFKDGPTGIDFAGLSDVPRRRGCHATHNSCSVGQPPWSQVRRATARVARPSLSRLYS